VPLQNEYTWNFNVDSGNENAELVWDNSFVKAFSNELYLLDEQEQVLTDMMEQTHYLVRPGKSSSFKIFFGLAKDRIKPSKVTLGQPYPNPFRDRCNVAFTLPENNAGEYSVSLEIYDALGRKVCTLVQGSFNSGFYEALWNPQAADINGSLYFYRLNVSDKLSNVVLTQKIMKK